MSDISEPASSDAVGGHDRKLKIMHLIARQKINFKRRKPSASANSPITPLRSASEHRIEAEPVGSSRNPVESRFGGEKNIGDVPTPETTPGRSVQFSEEPTFSPALRSYESPIESTRRPSDIPDESITDSSRVTIIPITPATEIDNSVRTSNISSRNGSLPVIDNEANDSTAPGSENQLVRQENEQSYPRSEVRHNDVSAEDTDTVYCMCSPCCDSKTHRCCWGGFLGLIIALISIILVLWLWYRLCHFPSSCGYSFYPRNTQCNLENPRWII